MPHFRKILFCAPRFDYGLPELGASPEELHMVHTLLDMGVQVERFDFRKLIQELGSPQIVNEALRTELDNDYDAVFYVPFEGWEISDETWVFGTDVIKIIWLFNDAWRYPQLGKEKCWSFNVVVSDDPRAVDKYKSISYDGKVVYLPRACRTGWLSGAAPEDVRLYDLTFIGSPYGQRTQIATAIKELLPDLNIFIGHVDGRKLPWEEYIRVLRSTKIGLSLGMASGGTEMQIKMRDFEISASGAMLLSNNPGLEEVYDLGVEAILFGQAEDILTKVRYFLDHPDDRIKVATAGQSRTLAEHDYTNRFTTLFSLLGNS